MNHLFWLLSTILAAVVLDILLTHLDLRRYRRDHAKALIFINEAIRGLEAMECLHMEQQDEVLEDLSTAQAILQGGPDD